MVLTGKPDVRRTLRAILGLAFGILCAALILSVASAAPASADEVGQEYDYQFSGNVKYNSEPLEDVRIVVTGDGYEAETVTDAEGKWRVGVPEKSEYNITLDETTLPEGVVVTEGAASVDVEFGLTNNKSVNFFLGKGVRQTTSFIDQLIERIMNGLNFGLLLALASIGASLIFGTTGLSNFAHGEMVTFGAVVSLALGVFLDWPMWVTLPLAVVLSGAFGLVLDAGLWRPLRHKGVGTVQVMIVSIGLSLLVRYVYQFFIGGGTYQLPGSGGSKIRLIGPIALTPIDMISMAISIVVLIAFGWWLINTKTGKATRAISDNIALAAASGIDVDRVIRIVWVIAGALAGLAGILWAYFRPGVKWDMGTQILLLVFAAITLGGLGTAFGALLGSLIVGLLVEVSTLWIPPDLKYVGALVVLIVVLLFRPQGLLGRRERIG